MDAMIYAIRCAINGMHYVGCTGNLAKRFREHRCLLRAGKHVCQKLQSDWVQYGEAAFTMTPLEPFVADTVSTKREKETKWMRYFEERGQLYNESLISFDASPDTIRKAVEASARLRKERGYRHSAESNLRRSLAQKGIPKGHGAKISATKRAKKVMR